MVTNGVQLTGRQQSAPGRDLSGRARPGEADHPLLRCFDSGDPEDLWAFMAGYEKKTGGQVLAIPHNPNVSNGVMFAETVKGKAMTRGLRRAPRSLGTSVGGHPDEGRQRGAFLAFPGMTSSRTSRTGTSVMLTGFLKKTGCCSTNMPVQRSRWRKTLKRGPAGGIRKRLKGGHRDGR